MIWIAIFIRCALVHDHLLTRNNDLKWNEVMIKLCSSKCASRRSLKQTVYFLFSLLHFSLVFSLVRSFARSLALFPVQRYVSLDKYIHSPSPLFPSRFFVLFLSRVVVVDVVVCKKSGKNTAADGQHAFASVHSVERGGTHAQCTTIWKKEHKKMGKRKERR